jgi:hypothetical protein
MKIFFDVLNIVLNQKIFKKDDFPLSEVLVKRGKTTLDRTHHAFYNYVATS